MPNEQPLSGATRTAANHDARIVTPQERAGALEFLQGLSAEMAAGKVNLPCFPDVVVRIRRALANPQTQIAQTVKIVGTEPRLAARILQTANSAVFNLSGKPVSGFANRGRHGLGRAWCKARRWHSPFSRCAWPRY